MSEQQYSELLQAEAAAQLAIEAQTKKSSKQSKQASKSSQPEPEIVKKSPPVTLLYFGYKSHISENLSIALKWCLPVATHLDALIFNLVEMSDISWDNILQALREAKIKTLSFTGMGWLSPQHLRPFFQTISESPMNLRHLSLRTSQIGTKVTQAVPACCPTSDSSPTEDEQEISLPPVDPFGIPPPPFHSPFLLIEFLQSLIQDSSSASTSTSPSPSSSNVPSSLQQPLSTPISLPLASTLTTLNLTSNLLNTPITMLAGDYVPDPTSQGFIFTPSESSIPDPKVPLSYLMPLTPSNHYTEGQGFVPSRYETAFTWLMYLLPSLPFLQHLSLSANGLGDKDIYVLSSAVSYTLLPMEETMRLKKKEEEEEAERKRKEEEEKQLLQEKGGKKAAASMKEKAGGAGRKGAGKAAAQQPQTPSATLPESYREQMEPSAAEEGSERDRYAQIRAKYEAVEMRGKRMVIKNIPLDDLIAFLPNAVVEERRQQIEFECKLEKARLKKKKEQEKKEKEEREKEELRNLRANLQSSLKTSTSTAPSPSLQQASSSSSNQKLAQTPSNSQQNAKANTKGMIGTSSTGTKSGSTSTTSSASNLPPVEGTESGANVEAPAAFVPPSSYCWIVVGNRTLQSVSLKANPFGLFGAQCLAKAVEVNNHFQVVEVDNNGEVIERNDMRTDNESCESSQKQDESQIPQPLDRERQNMQIFSQMNNYDSTGSSYVEGNSSYETTGDCHFKESLLNERPANEQGRLEDAENQRKQERKLAIEPISLRDWLPEMMIKRKAGEDMYDDDIETEKSKEMLTLSSGSVSDDILTSLADTTYPPESPIFHPYIPTLRSLPSETEIATLSLRNELKEIYPAIYDPVAKKRLKDEKEAAEQQRKKEEEELAAAMMNNEKKEVEKKSSKRPQSKGK
eukprot:MONOS_15307.1-p1 / transcript=MONOS_15307.1 / gene=MONOS_15307 / organism=Monocercomonoides_exilis_PA203 / gene_product=unspecified product / transcript_product=unspecified product / location=Mono_scaffold01194:5135-8167(-) / protein_length=911 / sequence_SO=supercontig / SO=protein_coding / is_pseudo=false